MSFVDKFKKILFDEVDETEELPERTPKNNKKEDDKHNSSGFIDYHNGEEEENPIREIKIPKEEKTEVHVEEKANKFNFPVDTEFDREIPSRTRNYDEMDINLLHDDEEDIKLVKEVNSFTTEVETSRKERDLRDYRKILEEKEEPVKEKKPFTNTPVISPVWGILDKNYKPEEIVDRTDALTKVNTGVTSPRSFGPVSYNDQPLIQKAEKPEKQKKNEELIELNTAITDLINEPIEKEELPKPNVKKPSKVSEKRVREKEERDIPSHSIDDIHDEIIKTDDYDSIEEVTARNYESKRINAEESDNNNIEDAFESTSEFDSIIESDSEENIQTVTDDEEELVDLDSIVNKKADDDDEDDAGLDNTIETDLFNLIDSMYKDEDE